MFRYISSHFRVEKGFYPVCPRRRGRGVWKGEDRRRRCPPPARGPELWLRRNMEVFS